MTGLVGNSGGRDRDEISSAASRRWPTRSIDPRLQRALTGIVITVGLLLAGPRFATLFTADRADPAAAPSSTAPPAQIRRAVADSPPALTWQPRGALEETSPFARRALARVGAETCTTTRLLYASNLNDRSRLALVGCVRESAEVAAPAVAVWAVHEPTPALSPAVHVTRASPVENDGDLTVWAGRGSDGRVHVVALGRPGVDSLEVSGRLTRDEGGNLFRRWRTEQVSDGVLVTELRAGAGPIVLVRRSGARAVASDVAYSSPRAKGADPHVAGLTLSSYRGPDPVTVRRLVAAAVRHVLPSHPASAEVAWSGAGTTGATALIKVRLGREAGLHLLVEDAGLPAGTTAQFLAPAVARELDELGAVATSSVVITLMDGRSRRVPGLHGPRIRDMDPAVLAGSAFTVVDVAGRVTVVDAAL